MRHILRETWSGLRRNGSMNLAVIVTMWVSLTLFGAGLMVTQQVDLLKGNWYDRIEISVFLCVESSRGGTCEPGVAATDAERNAIETALKDNPEVREVYYESKADAWAAFREAYPAGAVPLLVAGGPRFEEGSEARLGVDRIFGRGTTPGDVASYLVHALVQRSTRKDHHDQHA